MKAEINNENKAKFFAQYWGQDIVFHDKDSMFNGYFNSLDEEHMYNHGVGGFSLELKPLSSISDEDAISICRILFGNAYSMPKVEAHHGKLFVKRLEGFRYGNLQDNFYLPEKSLHVFNLLISKGYALPWMGLSIEEMVKAGWIKLIEL